MKIPLDITNRGLVLVAFVSALRYRIHGLITFIIDTGSDTSFIGGDDSARFNVPVDRLPLFKYVILGGTKIDLHLLKDVHLTFKNSESLPFKIKLAQFSMGKATWSRKSGFETVPSILGLDFLIENKLSLHLDVDKNEAYLETSL
ncbi:MAG: hypothetical protein ABIG30_02175 [Candidatus Aenigmatarchaeota archaeon]